MPTSRVLNWYLWESRFEKGDGCWIWKGLVHRHGYGVYHKQYAHRLAYELYKGPIPAGMHIDHICMEPLCVNPDHMEIVTNAENQFRKTRPRKATEQCEST